MTNEEITNVVADLTEAKPIAMDKGLSDLVNRWKTVAKKQEDCWLDITEYVSNKGLPKDLVRLTLMEIVGMSVAVARNEASVIARVANYPEEIKECRGGKITVRHLRTIPKLKMVKEPEYPG